MRTTISGGAKYGAGLTVPVRKGDVGQESVGTCDGLHNRILAIPTKGSAEVRMFERVSRV